MKKINFVISLFLIISVLSFAKSTTNFNLGMSVLTTEKRFDLGIKMGFETPVLDVDFELSSKFTTPLYFITMLDVSANLAKMTQDTSLDLGILWLNDRLNSTTSEASPETRNLPYIYAGFKYEKEWFYGKLYFGYPITQTTPSINLADYLILKVGFTIPKPTNVIDNLRFDFRFTKDRRDFSFYLSTPIF